MRDLFLASKALPTRESLHFGFIVEHGEFPIVAHLPTLGPLLCLGDVLAVWGNFHGSQPLLSWRTSLGFHFLFAIGQPAIGPPPHG